MLFSCLDKVPEQNGLPLQKDMNYSEYMALEVLTRAILARRLIEIPSPPLSSASFSRDYTPFVSSTDQCLRGSTLCKTAAMVPMVRLLFPFLRLFPSVLRRALRRLPEPYHWVEDAFACFLSYAVTFVGDVRLGLRQR